MGRSSINRGYLKLSYSFDRLPVLAVGATAAECGTSCLEEGVPPVTWGGILCYFCVFESITFITTVVAANTIHFVKRITQFAQTQKHDRLIATGWN